MKRSWVFMKKRILALLLAILMALPVMVTNTQTVSASVPSLTASVTSTNILNLMYQYNRPVYSYMNTMKNAGYDLTTWYDSGEKLINGIETTAHEIFHNYTFYGRSGLSEKIYAGYGVSYTVDFTDLYTSGNLIETSKWAKNISSSLQTFRYDTYVSEGSTCSSNVHGIYGLLNEFSAYFWGMSATDSLIPYYKTYDDSDPTIWIQYAKDMGNNMNAYAEFKFWILGYMNYLKSNYPTSYNAIISNKNFCNAYTAIETNYANLIADVVDNVPALNVYLSSLNVSLDLTDEHFYLKNGNTYSGVKVEDYTTLMNYMSSKSYFATIDNAIKSHASTVAQPTISSCLNKSNGIYLAWGKVTNATGYIIYRSDNDGRWTKVTTVTGTSYTDTAATTNGRRYEYRIYAYKTSGSSTIKSPCSPTVVKYRLNRPVIKSLASNSSGKVTLTRSVNSQATGYNIRYSTDSSFGSYKTVTIGSSTTSKTISGLTSGKTYYFKIRAYKTRGNTKSYSYWSAVKSIKVK